jgi:hypothetical protein
MSTNVVFATATTLAAHPRHGGVVEVTEGSHWLAEDPLVKAYPTLFSTDPKVGLKTSDPLDESGEPNFLPVPSARAAKKTETADATPGTARTRTTPARKAAAKKAAPAKEAAADKGDAGKKGDDAK